MVPPQGEGNEEPLAPGASPHPAGTPCAAALGAEAVPVMSGAEGGKGMDALGM